MAAYFFDTSGIVKRYIQETGTTWVQNLADPTSANFIYLSRVSSVEVASATARRLRTGSLTGPEANAILAQFRLDMAAEYRIVEISPPLLDAAMVLAETRALRAYDAVQLAAALELDALRTAGGLPPLTLVSSDQHLNAAAAACGLLVEDPNLHP